MLKYKKMWFMYMLHLMSLSAKTAILSIMIPKYINQQNTAANKHTLLCFLYISLSYKDEQR